MDTLKGSSWIRFGYISSNANWCGVDTGRWILRGYVWTQIGHTWIHPAVIQQRYFWIHGGYIQRSYPCVFMRIHGVSMAYPWRIHAYPWRIHAYPWVSKLMCTYTARRYTMCALATIGITCGNALCACLDVRTVYGCV